MADELSADLLANSWLRAFEEDTGDEQVLRPESYDFPPARRPRDGMELRPGGELVSAAPGPDDRRVRSSGTWELRDGRLILNAGSGTSREFEVVSANHDKLVVRPVSPQR